MTTPPTNQAFANDQLSAYLDGELGPAEMQALERALQEDAELRAELEELERVVGLLKAHGPARAPDDFHARVMAAVEAEHPSPSLWDWLRRPFGLPIEGLAIALAAAVVLWFALPQAVEPPRPDIGEVEATTPAVAVPKAKREIAQDKLDASEGVAPAKDEMANAKPAPAPPAHRPEPKAAEGEAAPQPAPSEPAEQLAGGGVDELPVEQPEPVAQGIDEDAPELRSAGYSYVVYVEDADALNTLQRIAGKHGGVIHDANDKPLRSAKLDASETQVYVHLPGDELTLFSRDLEAQMMRVKRLGSSELFYGSDIRVSVQIKWIGSATDDGQHEPKNATKSRRAREADVLDALEAY